VIEAFRSIVALGVAVALGTLLDVGLRFAPRSSARWPIRVLSALVVLYLVHVLPVVLALVVVAGLLTRPAAPQRVLFVAPRSDRALAWLGVAVLAVLTVLRSPTTLYWDEMVWLAKARIEATAPGALTAEALRIGTSTVPPGYPLFEPLAVSGLAGYGTSTTSLVFGAELLTIVAGAALVLTVLQGRAYFRVRRDVLAAALAGACPLVLVHLRSAYVDLELGMLAATLLLLLEARETRAAVVVGTALVAMKDEGIAHLLAVCAATLVIAAVRGRKRDALHAIAVAGVGAGCFAAWRARLAGSRVVDADHALGLPSLSRLPDVLHIAFVQASDVLAWGCLWAAVAGLAVAAVVRPSVVDRRTRARLLSLGAQAALLLGAILCSPERVMEFVHAGTLLPRLLVQLAPSAVLALAASLGARP
jgi:hypothetical protein